MINLFKKRAKVLYRMDSDVSKTNPCVRLVQMILAQAVEDKAKAVVFGVPVEVKWDWEEKIDEHKKAMEEVRAHPESIDKAIWELVDRMASLTPAESGGCPLQLDGTNMEVPVWFDLGGEFVQMVGVPSAIFLEVFSMLNRLRVGIDYEGEEQRSPLRFIELVAKERRTRRFVDVGLNMARDNTMRVELFGERVETRSVQAVRMVEEK